MPNKPNRQVFIILFNCKEDVNTYEEVSQKQMQAINFNAIIEDRLKKFILKNEDHLNIITPDYKAYCGTDVGPTVSKEIDIYGKSGLSDFIALAIENDWKIYDKHLDKFIDLGAK